MIRLRLPRWSMRRAAVVLAFGLIAFSLAAGALTLATARGLMPLPDTLTLVADEPGRLRFVDRNGVPLNTTYLTEWNFHDQLALHEIPPFLRLAFIHAEDKRFREHRGPDWIARLSALATNLRYLDRIRGASTLSEQVVRMLHPRPRTVWSRWLEGFEAARLERRFGKDRILEFYLNQVPYASRRRGVRQAAELYFARDLTTLSDREMLSLAVLVRSPSRLDLRNGPDASAAAVGRLADAMLERGALSAARHDQILAHPVELEASSLAVAAPHFLRFATSRARELSLADEVGTTLDARLQSNVQDLLDSRVRALASLGVENGAVLVADNATGEVLAWVVSGGGRPSGPISHIDPITTPRQPGSALKPLLYALALENGHTLADVIVDAPLAGTIGNGLHHYRNYSGQYYGPVTLRDALSNSLNIPAVKLLNDVGANAFLAHLAALGFTSLDSHPDIYGDGLALGNGAVTLYELVQAYLALANRGRATPLKVLSAPGSTGPHRTTVSAETASLIADALSDPEARAAEFGRDSVLNLPVQTAVKTGTSSDYRDAWTVGFDSRYTVGIWMGNLNQMPTNGVTGSIGPALLLRSVFAHLNLDAETSPLYLSPRLTRRSVCVPSPLRPRENCLVREEWFDPAHEDRAASIADSANGSAASEPIRMRQPTGGLELAWDPRLPAEAQAFRFVLDGIEPGDRVDWTIDGETHEATGRDYVWTVARGSHRVGANVSRAGTVIANLAPVEFTVR